MTPEEIEQKIKEHVEALVGKKLDAAKKSAPTKFFLINLKRRPDRLKDSLYDCRQAGIEPTVIEAVDGNAIRLPVGWKMGGGTYGCLRSHINVLQHAYDSGLEDITVLEDDVTFVPEFQEKYEKFMQAVPEDWQALFLGGQVFTTQVQINDKAFKSTGDKGIHRTHAYRIRGDYIPYLLNVFKACQTHCDHCWGAVQQKQVGIYGALPWLAHQNEGVSDINGRNHELRKWPVRQTVTPKGCTACGKKKN